MKLEAVKKAAQAILEQKTTTPEQALLLLEQAWQTLESANALDRATTTTLREKIFNQLETHHKKTLNRHRLLQLYRQRLTFKDALQSPTTRIRFLLRLADQYVHLGQLEPAQQHYETALAAHTLPTSRFQLLQSIARFLWRQGETHRAKTYFERALEQAQALGDESLQFQVSENLGGLARDLKEFELAKEYYFNCLLLLESKNDLYANTLYNLAGVHFEQKEYDKVLDYDQQALEIFLALGDQEGIVMTQGGIAEIHELHTLNFDAALELNWQSIEKSRPLKDHFMRDIEAARWLSVARVLFKSPAHLSHPRIENLQNLLETSSLPLAQRCLERAFALADEHAFRSLLVEIEEAREKFGL